MHRLNTSFVLGYHGCSEAVAEKVLADEPFTRSENDYDWLGPGIYFWQANPKRALQFALEKKNRYHASWMPTVVGAVIEPGLCLDLSTDAGIEHVKAAHKVLVDIFEEAQVALPKNSGGADLLLRKLDCAVMRMLHDIRESRGLQPIDTISGIFIEGTEAYPTSGFREKTHIQVCVCKPANIHGVFRVPTADLAG